MCYCREQCRHDARQEIERDGMFADIIQPFQARQPFAASDNKDDSQDDGNKPDTIQLYWCNHRVEAILVICCYHDVYQRQDDDDSCLHITVYFCLVLSVTSAQCKEKSSDKCRLPIPGKGCWKMTSEPYTQSHQYCRQQ